MLYNLIHNAVKYTPETRPPKILVRSFIAGDYIVVSVKDNGIGMGADDKQTIFEKFTRATKLVDGSGVGLYLVNTIVKQTGGKIDLISEPGQGTEVKIFLKQS